MRKIAVTVLLLFALMRSDIAHAAAPAFVGNGDNHWTHANEDCTRTSDVLTSYTVGNETTPLLTLEAYAIHYGTTTLQPCPTSVTDNNGGTWQTAYTWPSGNGCGGSFYSESHPAGATVITVHWSAGTPTAANQCGYVGQFSEVSGIKGSGSLDKTATSLNASNATQASGTTAATTKPIEWSQAAYGNLNSLSDGFSAVSNGYTMPTCSGCSNNNISAAAGSNTINMLAVGWKSLSVAGATNSDATGFGGGTFFGGFGGIATFIGQDNAVNGGWFF